MFRTGKGDRGDRLHSGRYSSLISYSCVTEVSEEDDSTGRCRTAGGPMWTKQEFLLVLNHLTEVI